MLNGQFLLTLVAVFIFLGAGQETAEAEAVVVAGDTAATVGSEAAFTADVFTCEAGAARDADGWLCA